MDWGDEDEAEDCHERGCGDGDHRADPESAGSNTLLDGRHVTRMQGSRWAAMDVLIGLVPLYFFQSSRLPRPLTARQASGWFRSREAPIAGT